MPAMPENPEVEAVAQAPRPEEPAAKLIREALDEVRDLVRLEVALAREEARSELTRAKASAIALSAAAVLAVSAFSLFMVAISAAFASMWLVALILGGILACLAAVLASFARGRMPKGLLGETKERLSADLQQLKERIA
jgi:hypothetical protein